MPRPEKAWGADILIDVERFQAGVGKYQQMDETQDQAEIHLLVLSPDYLASAPCLHEMKRAIATDPSFGKGCVLPVVREACTLPPEIKLPDPIYVKLIDDSKGGQWDLVTAKCGADLGVSAAEWLRVRQQVRDAMLDGQSVNLVVKGSPNREALLAQLRGDLGGLAIVDLASGAVAGRQNLVTEILHELGRNGKAQEPPHDLLDLDEWIMAASSTVRLAFRHFDIVKSRADNYGVDFFSALKYLTEKRKITLLIESREAFSTLLPAANPLSAIQMKTVELQGRTL